MVGESSNWFFFLFNESPFKVLILEKMWILDPVANEKLYNLQYPIAQNSRMQYKKSIIKGAIGMLFVFTGNTQKNRTF